MEVMKNFLRYNEKGQRVAIFGKQNVADEMEIFVLACSKKDQFNKKYANEIYAHFDKTGSLGVHHPITYSIPIQSGDSVHYTFMRHCKKNFYKKQVFFETVYDNQIFVETEFIKDKKVSHINGKIKTTKLVKG